MCSPSGATEKDVRDMCDKLLDYSDFDNLARAIVNSINYSVLNYGLIDFKERDFGKMFNNMTEEEIHAERPSNNNRFHTESGSDPRSAVGSTRG